MSDSRADLGCLADSPRLVVRPRAERWPPPLISHPHHSSLHLPHLFHTSSHNSYRKITAEGQLED